MDVVVVRVSVSGPSGPIGRSITRLVGARGTFVVVRPRPGEVAKSARQNSGKARAEVPQSLGRRRGRRGCAAASSWRAESDRNFRKVLVRLSRVYGRVRARARAKLRCDCLTLLRGVALGDLGRGVAL